jgi:two-component system chemotaxis response regulator CheV
MSGIMASIDQRTQLAGRNRLELLMFRLNSEQLYGINVFKVREILQCPPLSMVPKSHPVVRGIVNIRGKTISVMDLSMAIGEPPITDLEQAFVIISEYNRRQYVAGNCDYKKWRGGDQLAQRAGR